MKTTTQEGSPMGIVDAEYEHGVPGRACLDCDSGWPATEADNEAWHHDAECPSHGATK